MACVGGITRALLYGHRKRYNAIAPSSTRSGPVTRPPPTEAPAARAAAVEVVMLLADAAAAGKPASRALRRRCMVLDRLVGRGV